MNAMSYAFLNLAKPRRSGIRPSPELIALASTADAEAIDRILAAVGQRHIPPDLDRRALCADISDAYHSRDHAFDLFHGSEARAQRKLLGRIRTTAEKLASLLKKDDAVTAMIASASPKPIDQLNEFLRAVRIIEKSREHVAIKWRTAHKHDPALRGRRPTEKECLAGVSLPLVFEWHFHQRASRSRTKDGNPSGPTVRFIGATMKELDLPYDDESIMRAYSLRAPLRDEARKGNIRPLISRQI
jgi:hypothetical protein